MVVRAALLLHGHPGSLGPASGNHIVELRAPKVGKHWITWRRFRKGFLIETTYPPPSLPDPRQDASRRVPCRTSRWPPPHRPAGWSETSRAEYLSAPSSLEDAAVSFSPGGSERPALPLRKRFSAGPGGTAVAASDPVAAYLPQHLGNSEDGTPWPPRVTPRAFRLPCPKTTPYGQTSVAPPPPSRSDERPAQIRSAGCERGQWWARIPSTLPDAPVRGIPRT